jgi:hypothetical protein
MRKLFPAYCAVIKVAIRRTVGHGARQATDAGHWVE